MLFEIFPNDNRAADVNVQTSDNSSLRNLDCQIQQRK